MNDKTLGADTPSSMVVLRSASGRHCAKTFRMNPDHTGYDVESYSMELRWIPSLVKVDSLDRLHEVIESLASYSDRIVVHGTLPPDLPINNEQGVFRRLVGSPGGAGHFSPMGRQWLPFDLDAVVAPPEVPATDDALIAWAVSRFPAPITGCSCVYQWTSSYLLSGDPRVLRLRLWFWLDAPLDPARLRAWLDTVENIRVDDSIYRPVQPIYVNAPVFTDGADDPVMVRVGRYTGERDMVLTAGFPAVSVARAGDERGVCLDDTDLIANREQIETVKARILAQRTSKARHYHALGAACELIGIGCPVGEAVATLTELIRSQGREPQPNEVVGAIRTAQAKQKQGTLRTETVPPSRVFPAEPADGPADTTGFVDKVDEETGEPEGEPDDSVEADFGKHGWLNAVRYGAKYYPDGGLVRWQENDYEWTGTHYRVMEAEALRAAIQRNTGLTPAIVEATMKALRSRNHANIETAPAWLNDANRRASNLISFKNGVLDIDRWLLDPATRLLPHDKNLFTLATLPINYDPQAGCPTFDAWLPQVFPGDEDQQTEFKKMLGYLFIDGNPFHKLFVLLGRPRAGKGITQRLMQAMVGAKNTAATDLTLLGSQFGLANLVGKRMAVIGEMNEQKHSHISTTAIDALKRISGGDTIGVDRKNHSIVEMALPVRFVCACNRMPAFLDPSGALADRIVLFNFKISHSGREDIDLEPRMHNEMAGIVNQALAALRMLLLDDRGFKTPASVKAELEGHRDAMAPVRQFAKDCLVYAKDGAVVTEDIYKVYRQWALDEGRSPLNKANLMKELHDYFPDTVKVREAGGSRRWMTKGLGFSEHASDILGGGANAFA